MVLVQFYATKLFEVESVFSQKLQVNNTNIVVNIWSGSKKFIKVVLRQERILVLGFSTTLIKGFDPLQMLTSVIRNNQQVMHWDKSLVILNILL